MTFLVSLLILDIWELHIKSFLIYCKQQTVKITAKLQDTFPSFDTETAYGFVREPVEITFSLVRPIFGQFNVFTRPA